MNQLSNITHAELNGASVFGFTVECNGKTYEYRYVSYVENEVKQLIRRMSSSDLSPVHFNDVVRDAILAHAYEMIEANGL